MRLRASVLLVAALGTVALVGCSSTNSIVESSTENRVEYYFNEVGFSLAPEWTKQNETEVNNDNYQILSDDNLVGFTFVSQSYIGNLADATQEKVDSWVDGINKSGVLALDNVTPIKGQGYTAYLASASVDSSGVKMRGKAKLMLSGGTIYSVIATVEESHYKDSTQEIDAIMDSADIESPIPLFDNEWLQELGMDDNGSNDAQQQSSSTTITEGTYLVGTDIQAGEYKLTGTSSDGSGYWEVKNSSAPDAEIVGNDFFTGTSYVTVSDGQYLTLSNATAEQVQ